MKLKELFPYVVDNVCIYVDAGDGEYENLYTGALKNAPTLLLESAVRLIGAASDILPHFKWGPRSQRPKRNSF